MIFVTPGVAVCAIAKAAIGAVRGPDVICTPAALKKSMPPSVAPESVVREGGSDAKAVPPVAIRTPPARTAAPAPVNAFRNVAFMFFLFC